MWQLFASISGVVSTVPVIVNMFPSALTSIVRLTLAMEANVPSGLVMDEQVQGANHSDRNAGSTLTNGHVHVPNAVYPLPVLRKQHVCGCQPSHHNQARS